MKTTIRPDISARLIDAGLMAIISVILFFLTEWYWVFLLLVLCIAIFNLLAPSIDSITIADGRITVKKSRYFKTTQEEYLLKDIEANTGRFSLDIAKNDREYLRIPPPRGHSKKHLTIYADGREVCALIIDSAGWTSKRVALVMKALQQNGVKATKE